MRSNSDPNGEFSFFSLLIPSMFSQEEEVIYGLN